MRIKRIQVILYKLFHGAFGLLLLALLAAGILSWQYHGSAAFVAALVLGAGLLAALHFAGPRIDAMPVRRFHLLFGGIAVFYLALLVVLGTAMAEVLISDMGVVYDTLTEFLAYGHPLENNDYYIICNNNLGLALLLYAFYALAGVFGIAPDGGPGIMAGICLNAVFIFAAVVLLACAAKKATEKNSVKLLFLVCAILFAPLYLWAPYFYSDTLSMPFLAGAILLYLCWREKPCLPYAVGFGGLVFLAYAVKGSLVVVLVAALITLLVAPPPGVGKKQLAAGALTMLLGFGVLWGGYQLFQQRYLDWSDREEVCFPTELWLCYGSHGTGDYADEDAQDCRIQPTLTDRQVLMRERITQNYTSRTPVGNLAFIFRKAVSTWTDGEYGAQEYLAAPLRTTFAARFTLYGQPGFMPLLYYCQAWQYLLLLLCGIGSLLALRTTPQDIAGFMPRVALFGAMIFFSFWETKSRYALHFSPVLLFCAVLALATLTGLKKKSPAPAREEATVS